MKRAYVRHLTIAVCACIFVSSLTGCAAIRKKFTRKKKKEAKAEFEPVLNPIDYPPPSKSVSEKYAYHASLRRVWHKSVLESIEGNESDKRIKYFFDQLIVQADEMIRLLTGDKKIQGEELMAKLKGIRKEFDRPEAMRQVSTIERKLRLLDGDFQDELSVNAVEENLVPTL